MPAENRHQDWVIRLDHALEYRKVRKALALAAEIGVDQSAVSRWRKKRSISIEHAVDLCNALDISLDWLLTGRGDIEGHKKAASLEDILACRLFTDLPGDKAKLAARRLIDLLTLIVSKPPHA